MINGKGISALVRLTCRGDVTSTISVAILTTIADNKRAAEIIPYDKQLIDGYRLHTEYSFGIARLFGSMGCESKVHVHDVQNSLPCS